MRLRNIPGADEVVGHSPLVVHDPEAYKGRWKELFGNEHSIHIEVGMGKGKFITEMALLNPQVNYVGIERYTSVLLRAVQKREQMEEIPNLYYLCIDARELPQIFGAGEVERIYLNFSDPFKTDNRGLFEFALEEAKESGWPLAECTFDLHHDEKLMQGNVMTEYEEKFSGLGNPIHKMVILPPDGNGLL